MRFLVIIACIFWPVFSVAQTQEAEDKGYLTELLQDSLSAENQIVSIDGFAGALSSEATLERLTIADADGVWLTLENATLVWTRSALLRGAIDVDELSAKRLIIERAPLPSTAIPSAQATPFSLPDLPVSVSLGSLAIDEIVLGSIFLGEPVSLNVAGSAELSGGEGQLEITANRLDSREGRFDIKGSYENESRMLVLDLALEEAPDGIAARLLGLPGRPSVDLAINGAGPLADFAAELALGTDSTERMTGAFTLLDDGVGSQTFELGLTGDVSPLFAPAYQSFFGPDTDLVTRGVLHESGALELETVSLKAQHVALDGFANINAEGWPETIDLVGSIKDPSGGRVVLPLSGTPTQIDTLDLNLTYDASVSDVWQFNLAISELTQDELTIDDIVVSGGGMIAQDESDFSAALEYRADGLNLSDEGLSQALGDTISGALSLRRDGPGVMRVPSLTVRGPGLTMDLSALINTQDSFGVDLEMALNANMLERFRGIFGQEIAGAADLSIAGQIQPLDGIFDLTLNGATEDLALGIDRLDALLKGQGQLSGRIARTTSGSAIDNLRISARNVELKADANLDDAGGNATLTAEIKDISEIEPTLSGPVTLSAYADRGQSGIARFEIAALGPSVETTIMGTLNPTEQGQTANINFDLESPSIRPFAALAGRDIDGAVSVSGVALVTGFGAGLNAKIAGETLNLQTGQPELDALLNGQTEFAAEVSRLGDALLSIESLNMTNSAVRITGQGSLKQSAILEGTLNARLNDAARVFPSVSGPLTVSASAVPLDDGATGVTVDLDGAGLFIDADLELDDPLTPTKTRGRVAARVNDLAPFQALAKRPLEGSIDLTVQGRANSDLSSVAGTLAIATNALQIGIPAVDLLLDGAGSISAQAVKSGDAISAERFDVTTPELMLTGRVDARGSKGTAVFDAKLRDLGLFTDAVSGALVASGTAERTDAAWNIDVDADGPGGLSAAIDGIVRDAGTLAVEVVGRAPLGLANRVLEPRRLSGDARFNLSLDGPADIGALSGEITLEDARLALPTLSQALENITGGAKIQSGSATIDIRGTIPAGGSLEISGPVGLSAPFQSDVTIELKQVVLRDPTLFETSLNGFITARGPLAGGATISGDILIDETEVQVPSSGVGVLGELPDVVHINAPRNVRQTLARAGAAGGAQATTTSHQSGPIFPLGITVRAPSRIFIRGRGLDAELGGTLQIGGTSRDIVPVGQFELIRGRLNILQQRFDLTEGSASIQGDFEPYIRLVASTEADTGTVINITVEGPATEPVVTFQSSPELPQDEVLAQLIFGRNLSDISPLQAVQLASAVSTLAGRGGGALDTFRQNLGLDDLDFTTDDAGNAAVRAGAYLSENVYTDVTIASDGSTEINLNLDISDNVTATGSLDDDGGTSVGIFFQKDY